MSVELESDNLGLQVDVGNDHSTPIQTHVGEDHNKVPSIQTQVGGDNEIKSAIKTRIGDDQELPLATQFPVQQKRISPRREFNTSHGKSTSGTPSGPNNSASPLSPTSPLSIRSHSPSASIMSTDFFNVKRSISHKSPRSESNLDLRFRELRDACKKVYN